MRKLTYFVAVSVDGFIGGPDGDANAFMSFLDDEFLGFLKTEYPETISAQGRRALGLEHRANQRFDTVIQGRASYQLGLDAGMTSPYGHLREYVATRSIEKSPDPNVELVADDLVGKIRELKAEDGEFDIWLCGGATLAGELADEVDELVLKTYPVILGSGMPMFRSGFAVTEFEPTRNRTFGNGVTVRTYSRKRPGLPD
ncbi:dihydrofolate reductase [Streptomyces antnestii]|uniref:Dihydrofolate reductase n=1 Tax=Streptomyces antnestii TaxID=2494256 RepID=A0A3S2V8W0_9ACTN|nr:dihydrofolate reductase family protein [Streptomyces sp. San01]RVU17262.1 dihydrofolate reductase [Streptomyces sp. San01]